VKLRSLKVTDTDFLSVVIRMRKPVTH